MIITILWTETRLLCSNFRKRKKEKKKVCFKTTTDSLFNNQFIKIILVFTQTFTISNDI